MKKIKYIIFCLILVSSFSSANAEDNKIDNATYQQEPKKKKRAWEIGVGGTLQQLNRVYFSNFQKAPIGYNYDIKLRHALWGGDLYLARELNKYFYLDFTGGIGGTKVYNIDAEKKTKLFYTGSMGLQWRLSPYFKSKYIDPYFRVGVNYIHREFMVDYDGSQTVDSDLMEWVMTNVKNKEGEDKRNLLAISAGVGVNFWFNNRVGMGMQANYLRMPKFVKGQKEVADALQGVVRLLFRFGGENKKPIDFVERVVVEQIEVPIEKIIEREVVIEKEKEVLLLFQNLTFYFDSARVLPESEEILDKIANTLNNMTDHRILVTGFTDSKGNKAYNLQLSRRRAAAVVKSLERRGVPTEMLKSRGVGMSISAIPAHYDNDLRQWDRKVTVEVITNDAYWNFLKKSDL